MRINLTIFHKKSSQIFLISLFLPSRILNIIQVYGALNFSILVVTLLYCMPFIFIPLLIAAKSAGLIFPLIQTRYTRKKLEEGSSNRRAKSPLFVIATILHS